MATFRDGSGFSTNFLQGCAIEWTGKIQFHFTETISCICVGVVADVDSHGPFLRRLGVKESAPPEKGEVKQGGDK